MKKPRGMRGETTVSPARKPWVADWAFVAKAVRSDAVTHQEVHASQLIKIAEAQ